MLQKRLSNTRIGSVEQQPVNLGLAAGPNGRVTPKRESLGLQVTLYANIVERTITNGGEALGRKVEQSVGPVLVLTGTIPVDLHLMSENSEEMRASLGVNVPQIDPLPAMNQEKKSEDPWSNLEESALYVGISTSTLYKYSSQRKIESRKVGGRLQFRKSELDGFLEKQIRPARKGRSSQGIISPALCSGK